MEEKYLSETEIRKLLKCSRCKKSPTSPPVYLCRTGHLECSTCFFWFSEVPTVDETDASTDSESDCPSNKKGENVIGVIFPKDSKNKNNSHHSCPICKEEVLKTRNLLAENLLVHLESAKRVRKNCVPDSNCVECCYNIYPCPNMAMTTYKPQPYVRYQVAGGLHQYSFQVNPYLANDPTVEYNDPNIFYPDDENVSYYNGYGSRRELLDNRSSRLNFGPHTSAMSLAGEPSKRPIRCPTHLCGRNIAVTALSSHFSFDHPDVPPFSVDFDVSSHLFVVPDVIPFNYGRCVAMLLIPNRFEPVNSISHSNLISPPKGKNSLPLVVMASRLDCVTNPQSSTTYEETTTAEALNHGDFRARERCRPDTSNKSHTPPALGFPAPNLVVKEGQQRWHSRDGFPDYEDTGTRLAESEDKNVKTPLLVIWLAGIESNSSLFTTLQVTEKQTNIRSVVYTGPVTSLRSCQNTTKVFEQGDCLVIHSGILENIIGDRGGFDLHVVVH